MAEAAQPQKPTSKDAVAAIRRDFRLAGLLLLGMGPGLSITVAGGTLGFWLSENKFSPSQIGFLGLAMLPFVLKFLWGPLLEGSFKPLERLLGRRRSWLLPLNLLTVSAIVFLSQVDPTKGLAPIAVACLIFSFFAASQEVVIEGLRIDRTRGAAMPIGATLIGIGARLGILIGAVGPLLIAARMGWSAALLFVAAAMLLVSVGALIFGERPADAVPTKERESFKERLVDPFAEFFRRPGGFLIFAFVLAHRLGDSMAGSMFPPFATQAGFTKDQIAFGNGIVGFVALIFGSAIGLLLYRKMSERAGILIAMILMAVSNLGFVFLTGQGGNAAALAAVLGFENFAGGVGGVIVMSWLSKLCDVRFTATQFALLAAASAVMRILSGGPSGKLVEAIGYPGFFLITVAAFLPALILLAILFQRNLVSRDRPSGRPMMEAD
jgi:MFS transporter, PAT family, beta-lactamase induction signal transducer AmpG